MRADILHRSPRTGEVAEWSNAPDSKSGLRFYRNVGSNPTLSANKNLTEGAHHDRRTHQRNQQRQQKEL